MWANRFDSSHLKHSQILKLVSEQHSQPARMLTFISMTSGAIRCRKARPVDHFSEGCKQRARSEHHRAHTSAEPHELRRAVRGAAGYFCPQDNHLDGPYYAHIQPSGLPVGLRGRFCESRHQHDHHHCALQSSRKLYGPSMYIPMLSPH